MIGLHAYLNFPGNSREAMTYYQDIFGGTLEILTFGSMSMQGMPDDGTAHAALVTDHFSLFASDAMPGAEHTWGGTRVYLAFMGDDEATLRAWWERLAADGEIGMPLERQAWGDTFGLLKDRFGLEWMFNVSAPSAEA